MSISSAATADRCTQLAQALALHADHVMAVGGHPITHLAELLASRAARFEWALNEKSATESAIGLSASGRRTCVVLKHNGLNLALDPLVNAGLHSTGAAVVIVAGDDPSAAGSTSAQDSRLTARLARIPVLEPSLDSDAHEVVRTAVLIAESCGTPVLIRVTPELHASCEHAPAPATLPAPLVRESPAPRVDAAVAHGLTKLGRIQHQRLTTLPRAVDLIERCGLVTVRCGETCSDTALIAVGAAQRYLPEGPECRMTVRACWPVPECVTRFADRHNAALVVEEPGPVLEEHLRAATGKPEVHGRLTGHLPPEGALDAECVAKGLIGVSQHWNSAERKTAVPPPGRYDTVFRAVSRLRNAGLFVATDVGSSVRLCYPPYNGADVALCLGSSIAVAAGAARTRHRSIAVIGDFALLHSGLEPLIDAVNHRLPVLTIVLDNGVQAQIGGQPTPAADLRRLVAACGVTNVECWPLTGLSPDATFNRLCHIMRGALPAVAFITSQEQQ